MARWSRAVRQLRLPANARVLDLGCAFGFGTRLLAGKYQTYGHDLSEIYIARAHRAVPNAVFTYGPAHDLPYPDSFFDGMFLLDVLEHVPDESAVVDEIARVLRSGGQLVISVPNRGILGSLDSLNVFHRLTRDVPLPPTDDPSWPVSAIHRHYALEELVGVLGPQFRLNSVQYTGIGLAEPINLVLLLLLRRLFLLPRLYDLAQYLYFGFYLAEDLIRTGPWGYHLMVDVQRE